jgi:hypothetical protein
VVDTESFLSNALESWALKVATLETLWTTVSTSLSPTLNDCGACVLVIFVSLFLYMKPLADMPTMKQEAPHTAIKG